MQHQQLEPRLPVTPSPFSPPSPSLLASCVACRERERLLAVNVDDVPQPDLPRRSRTAAPSGCHSWRRRARTNKGRGIHREQGEGGGNSLACVGHCKRRGGASLGWGPGQARTNQTRPNQTRGRASQTGNPSISRWQTAIAGCTSMWIRYTNRRQSVSLLRLPSKRLKTLGSSRRKTFKKL